VSLDSAKWPSEFLNQLRRELDKELVEAGLLKDDASRRAPADAERWRVLVCADRDTVQRALGKRLEATQQGTGFYTVSAGRSLLAFVPSGDENTDRRNLLDYGGRQIMFHRVGFRYAVNQDARGSCLPFGFFAFLRWSFLPGGRGYPVHLGGMRANKLRTVQAVVRENEVVSLSRLFELRYSALVPGGRHEERFCIPAVLLVEFLWHDPKTRADLLRAFSEYAKRGHAPKRFPLTVLLKSTEKSLGTKKKLEARFHRYILENSDTRNKNKWRDATQANPKAAAPAGR